MLNACRGGGGSGTSPGKTGHFSGHILSCVPTVRMQGGPGTRCLCDIPCDSQQLTATCCWPARTQRSCTPQELPQRCETSPQMPFPRGELPQ